MTTPLLLPGQLISKQFFVPNLTGGLSYPLDTYAAFGYTVVAVNGLKVTNTGASVNATFKIGSTAISGLNGIAVNTTSSNNPVPTGGSPANVVAPGNTLSVVFDTPSSSPSPQNIQFTLVAARVDPLDGFLNKFRNPSMNIAQRGTGASQVSTSTPGGYTLDGWIVLAGTSGTTWSQAGATGNPISSNCLQITGAGTGSGSNDVSIRQRIEGSTAAPLANQTITVQLFFWNAGGGTSVTPTITVNHAYSVDNWTSHAAVNDQPTTSMQPIGSATSGIIAYTWNDPGSAANGLEIIIDFGSVWNSTSKYFYVTDFDMRATPGLTAGVCYNPPIPEARPDAVELAYCQRYFNSTFGNGIAPAQNAGLAGALLAQACSTSAGVCAQWNYPAQMRAIPTTITTYNPSNTNAYWRDVTNPADLTVTVDPSTSKGMANLVIGSSTYAGAVGDLCYIHATASAEL